MFRHQTAAGDGPGNVQAVPPKDLPTFGEWTLALVGRRHLLARPRQDDRQGRQCSVGVICLTQLGFRLRVVIQINGAAATQVGNLRMRTMLESHFTTPQVRLPIGSFTGLV